LHRIFAAHALRILLLAKWKTEDFRREMSQFAANFLLMQRKSRARRGFPRVFAASVARLAAHESRCDHPARHPQQRQFGFSEPRPGNQLETFTT